MKTTIDAAGRVVIPKALRDAARLEAGTELEAKLVGDAIELRPRHLAVRLERRGEFLVAVPEEDLPAALDRDAVEDTRRRVRTEREARSSGSDVE